MQRTEKVDRENVCPFLIRVFIRKNDNFRESEFTVNGGVPRDCEINIHTWKDATLKELCTLIKQVNEDARRRSSTLEFTSCFVGREGHFQFRQLGRICGARPSNDDRITLERCRFQPGDHLCVVIRDRMHLVFNNVSCLFQGILLTNHAHSVVVAEDSSSESSSGDDSVDQLLQALVPNSSSRDDLIVKKDDESIAKSITKIEDIRKTVSQIKDVNTTLEKLVHTYESTFSADDRLIVQKKISNVIERGNSIAASSRFAIQTLKLDYNNRLRGSISASVYNLYAQSYAAIAHSFVEYISEYQKLQQRYERQLQINYRRPSFLESASEEKEGQHPIQIEKTVPHQLVEACIESQMQYREIEKIQKSMREIQQMFFDLALLVDEQGELLDYVQINIDTTSERTGQTEVALRQAIERMKRMRKLKCCILMTILILLLIAGVCAYLFVKSLFFRVCLNRISSFFNRCIRLIFVKDSVN